ncbi:hypothetical protein [Mycoplasma tauri]|uniref:Uncharacterized protein n=1 Tax=Mycoplasma tauri TaxID=547987 RepID=A0A953NCM7_9MOLU|nr:hypothetical protein [Mycoplasma tauri]MBZ4195155.1 hypothetical protein [Mycoplasma tauri]MBZ4203620.1 hypothetical protein [Mycoplasma tauri]MBZ4204433.1 hypothetical protein [Mycoplasma tauri]MBZ4212430.1 hypothetical protein [Mycoplasma tauri]MBZ4218142.1 hypothetical protein [Mycoplasma tauri]
MTNNEMERIFKEIILSTPGVKQLLYVGKIDNKEYNFPFMVEKNDKNEWTFIATLEIIRNTNAKDLSKNISKLLKYTMKKKNEKIEKINLFIGGLCNE